MIRLLNRLSRGFALLSALRKPGGFRALCTWRPFSVTSFEIARRLRDAGCDFATIIDGGANVGQFARACAETWPTARIYSFEPLPSIAATLHHNLRDLGPRIQIHQVALGPEPATIMLHQTPYSLQSSVLKPTDLPYENIPVEQARLDDLLRGELLSPPLLLKLDLQGYEMDALNGAVDLLKQTNAVLLEISFKPVYESEPTFEVLRHFLAEHGFRLHRPLDVLWESDQIIQMDALFIRSDA